MAKTKTSKKLKALSAKDVKVVTLKPDVVTSQWSPTEELLDESKLARALFDALKDEDVEAFKDILSAHLEVKVKTRAAKSHGLSARTMFEALSEKGNPSLRTIAKIVKMACAS